MPVPPAKPHASGQKPAAATKTRNSTTLVENQRSPTVTKRPVPDSSSSSSRSARQTNTPNPTGPANGFTSQSREPTSPSPREHRRSSNSTASPKPMVDTKPTKSPLLQQSAQNGSHSRPVNNAHTDDDDAEFTVIEESAPEPIRRPIAQSVRHVGQPARIAAAPLPTPPKAPPQASTIHVNYEEEDFETYDDDFEEEFIDENDELASKSTTKVSSTPETKIEPDVPTQLPPPPAADVANRPHSVKKTEPPPAASVAVIDEANVAALLSTLHRQQQQQHSYSSGADSSAVIDFQTAQTQQTIISEQRAVARRAAKFSTIRRLVQFEMTHHRHFTLNPAGSHARYLELFGKQNVKLAASQTADEHAEEETQTEVPESFNVWTQHPSLSANQVSGRDDPSNNNKSTISNASKNMPSSSNILSFITQASDCILKLLNERRTTTNSSRQHGTNLNTVSLEGKSDVFANVLLVGPESASSSTSSFSIDYKSIFCVACNEPKMDRIATCHARAPGQLQSSTPPSPKTADMSVIFIWNINSPATPELALCTQDENSQITCCTFHKLDASLVTAGCSDGSLQCWSTRAASSTSAHLQFSLGGGFNKVVNVPLISAEFSSAPLGGGRWPPPHIAPIAALDEFIDLNGGRRVGIADISSSCTLALLDTCSTLCLWNVVTDSGNSRQRDDSVARKDTSKPARAQTGTPSTATTTTAAELQEFCITPSALSSASSNIHGKTGDAAQLASSVIRLIALSTVNILESTKLSRSMRPSSAVILLTTLPISYNSENCLVRFCPNFFNSNVGATTTLACLVDGRLYRVNNTSKQQSANASLKSTAKVVDRTPHNVPAASIVSFAFPPVSTSTSLSDVSNSMVACLHDIGNVSLVSFDTGQLLASWSSPLIFASTSKLNSPFSFDMRNLSSEQRTTQSLWWPQSSILILVGADATVVKFDFSSVNAEEGGACAVLNNLNPQVTVDNSMAKPAAAQNADGDSNRCAANFVGRSNVQSKLIILTESGPIAMLEIKPHS